MLRSSPFLILALTATFLTSPAPASEPVQVADLGSEPAIQSRFRSYGAAADGRLLYWAEDERSGLDLWITDGTPEGTRQWAETCPGLCRDDRTTSLEDLVIFDGERSYFIADDGIHGHELWRADGDPQNARLVADICPGSCSSEIRHPTLIGDQLYFFATTPELGHEPWVSDGTAAGTRLLGDLRPGSLSSGFIGFFPFATGAAFQAFDSEHGTEWWHSDGTPEGTRRLIDLCPGPCSATAANARAFKDTVIFSTAISTGTEILYRLRLDQPPEPLITLCQDGCDPFRPSLFPAGDRLILVKERTLFTTDGTAAGTAAISELPAAVQRIDDVLTLAGGSQLVITDQTAGGSALYRLEGDQLTGTALEVVADLYGTTLGDVAILVEAFGGAVKLWRSDGTAAGTVELDQLPTFHAGQAELPVTVEGGADGSVVVSARTTEFRDELWRTDGTVGGASRLVPVESRDPGANPSELVSAGPRVLFRAASTAGDGLPFLRDLWSTDGTAAGTIPLLTDVEPENMSPVGDGKVFFTAFNADATDNEPWVSDGTLAGTVPLGDLEPDGRSWAREAVPFGDSFYFFADSDLGQKLWRSDGTADSTEVVININPNWANVHISCPVCSPPLYPELIFPRDLRAAEGPDGDRLFFVAASADSGAELWQSDGSTAGTIQVADLRPGELGSDPKHLEASGQAVFFTADNDGDGRDLWVLGPFMTEPLELAESVVPDAAIALGGSFVWIENRSGHAVLSASDGSVAGTRVIAELEGAASPEMATLGDRLYFVLADHAAGAELWLSDLTAAGTARVADLRPGVQGSYPEQLRVQGGVLYFSADDGTNGRELWRLDGAVPRRLGDLNPGAASSSPRGMTRLGDQLLFAAEDGATGRELWAVGAQPPPCAEDDSVQCLRGDRFRVSVRWRIPQTGAQGIGRALPGTDDSALFWFFSPGNLELIVKVLDGRGYNDHHWLFYGALTDVEYWIDAEDLLTGTTRTFYNPPKELCGDADIEAFPDPLAAPVGPAPPAIGEPAPPASKEGTGCTTGGEILCLQDRFRITADWRSHDGTEGTAKALTLSEETGLFWFFDAANVELAVKVLDGSTFNGNYWVLFGALSDVEYTLRVVDTTTGAERTYHNQAGNICGQADIDAFMASP